MTRSFKFLVVVPFLLTSGVFAQTPLSNAEVKQHVSDARFSTTSPTGTSKETWISSSEGTMTVTRSGTLGAKAGASSSAGGSWSISDAGQYCVHVAWDISHGGAEDWCAPVAIGNDGSVTLTLTDGRSVAVTR